VPPRFHNLQQISLLSFRLFPSMIYDVHYAGNGLLTDHQFHKSACVGGSKVGYFPNSCSTPGYTTIHLAHTVDSL